MRSHRVSGWRAATSAVTSSQSPMVCGSAFDFVTLVSRPPSGTARNAYSTARSMPRRVKTEVWVAVSESVPAYSLPPRADVLALGVLAHDQHARSDPQRRARPARVGG